MIRLILLACALTTPAAAFEIAAGQDIVILGEVHDNLLHHEGQAEWIRAIRPKAIVFEMLSAEQAATLNKADRSDVAALSDVLDWESSSWPTFDLYQPVFEALGDLPAVGAAAPIWEVRRAFSAGAATVFGESAARYGLDAPLPDEMLATRKQIQFDAHCEAMPLDMMGGMVEAQRYRDASFADATLEALTTYGAPVIVIAGNGHARTDWGMPALIALAAPGTKTLSVGFVEAPSDAPPDPRFNHTVVTAPAERGDPCDVFKS